MEIEDLTNKLLVSAKAQAAWSGFITVFFMNPYIMQNINTLKCQKEGVYKCDGVIGLYLETNHGSMFMPLKESEYEETTGEATYVCGPKPSSN